MKKIKVENMNCVNCYKKIQLALLKESIPAIISLDNKTVEVEDVYYDEAVKIIKNNGYNIK